MALPVLHIPDCIGLLGVDQSFVSESAHGLSDPDAADAEGDVISAFRSRVPGSSVVVGDEDFAAGVGVVAKVVIGGRRMKRLGCRGCAIGSAAACVSCICSLFVL
jgi:hypothetical protein